MKKKIISVVMIAIIAVIAVAAVHFITREMQEVSYPLQDLESKDVDHITAYLLVFEDPIEKEVQHVDGVIEILQEMPIYGSEVNNYTHDSSGASFSIRIYKTDGTEITIQTLGKYVSLNGVIYKTDQDFIDRYDEYTYDLDEL